MRFLNLCPARCNFSGGCPACRLDQFGNFSVGDPVTPKGWECPKCSKVYAPDVKQCASCNNTIHCVQLEYQ